MDFGIIKIPIEIIKEGSFGGTYFRDIYSRINDKFYKNSCKEFKELESIDKKNTIVVIIVMSVLMNLVLNVAHH